MAQKKNTNKSQDSLAAAAKKKKGKKNISTGIAHINSSFNNTIITITTLQGNTIAWSSSGNVGFKGSRKSTPYAVTTPAARLVTFNLSFLGASVIFLTTNPLRFRMISETSS